jgi:hypothetical protein
MLCDTKNSASTGIKLHGLRAWHIRKIVRIPLVKERVVRSCEQIILRKAGPGSLSENFMKTDRLAQLSIFSSIFACPIKEKRYSTTFNVVAFIQPWKKKELTIKIKILTEMCYYFICSRTVGKWSGIAAGAWAVKRQRSDLASQPCLRCTKTNNVCVGKMGRKGLGRIRRLWRVRTLTAPSARGRETMTRRTERKETRGGWMVLRSIDSARVSPLSLSSLCTWSGDVPPPTPLASAAINSGDPPLFFFSFAKYGNELMPDGTGLCYAPQHRLYRKEKPKRRMASSIQQNSSEFRRIRFQEILFDSVFSFVSITSITLVSHM